jgi:antitoxin component of MazEF toxin-antitoxin module
MRTETKIARYGNSLTVRLPVAVVRELNVNDGDRVILRTVEDGVVIERPHHSRLAARLATVREREPELGAVHSVGKESLD